MHVSGELLGVEYLYSQTGIPLLDIPSEIAAMQQEEEEEGRSEAPEDQWEGGDEGFDEEVDPTILEEVDPTISVYLPADFLLEPCG